MKTNKYNFYAKCGSTECEKYKECARTLSERGEVNYYSLCSQENGDGEKYQWFVPIATELVKTEENTM